MFLLRLWCRELSTNGVMPRANFRTFCCKCSVGCDVHQMWIPLLQHFDFFFAPFSGRTKSPKASTYRSETQVPGRNHCRVCGQMCVSAECNRRMNSGLKRSRAVLVCATFHMLALVVCRNPPAGFLRRQTLMCQSCVGSFMSMVVVGILPLM